MAFSDLTAMTKMSMPSPRQGVMHRASRRPVPDLYPSAGPTRSSRMRNTVPPLGAIPIAAGSHRAPSVADMGEPAHPEPALEALAQLPRAVELDLAGSNRAFQRKIAHEYARHRPQVGRNVETHLESRVGGQRSTSSPSLTSHQVRFDAGRSEKSNCTQVRPAGNASTLMQRRISHISRVTSSSSRTYRERNQRWPHSPNCRTIGANSRPAWVR